MTDQRRARRPNAFSQAFHAIPRSSAQSELQCPNGAAKPGGALDTYARSALSLSDRSAQGLSPFTAGIYFTSGIRKPESCTCAPKIWATNGAHAHPLVHDACSLFSSSNHSSIFRGVFATRTLQKRLVTSRNPRLSALFRSKLLCENRRDHFHWHHVAKFVRPKHSDSRCLLHCLSFTLSTNSTRDLALVAPHCFRREGLLRFRWFGHSYFPYRLISSAGG